MDILPPSFDPGSGADKRARSAALRHQGVTSVVPGPGYEGYRGPQSSNWQYCQELPSEAPGQSSTGGASVEDRADDSFKPGHEKNGRIKELARRGLGAVAAFAFAVGGMFGVGHAASEASGAYTTTTCQEFEMHGAKPLPDGTVEASSADRGAIQAFLNENANGLSVDYLKVGTPQESGSEYSGMFRKGTVAEVCVTRNPISGNTDVDINTKVSPSNPSF